MSDYSELKRLAEAAIEQESRWKAAGEPWPVWNICLLEMQAAANPAAVLALIAEVDGLHAQHGRDSGELRKLCAARDSARRQRDQLRAEVAGLKTGYEAYEQVNAELKAEVERSEQHRNDQQDSIVALRIELASLRKDADRYRWLLQNWFTMSSEYMGGVSFQTGRSRWSDLPDEAVSEAIDAALGQGGQS